MAKKVFDIEYSVMLRIGIDDKLFDYVQTPEFKDVMYHLNTPAELAEFIGYSVARFEDNQMHEIEGFGDEHDSMMEVLCYPDWDTIECTEVRGAWGND
jgi:hypothetical protein